MESPLPYISAMVIGMPLCIAIMAACSVLTPAEDAGLLAADVAACSALSAIPTVGPFVALACPGEEALLKSALDRAVAESVGKDAGLPADAGVGVAVAAVTSAAPVPVVRLPVYRRSRRGRRKLTGYVPAPIAVGCQVALDAASMDGGGA